CVLAVYWSVVVSKEGDVTPQLRLLPRFPETGNSIRSIPAEAFNGIQNLEWINLGKNRITSDGIAAAAFRGLRFLRRLYLDENLLEHVPSDLPSTLQELKINENNLRTINEKSFQGLSSLIILEMEHNLLSETTVEPLAFSSLTHLSYLRLGHNHFRTVPQGLPSTLLELYLENNMIEEISETVFNRTTSLHLVSLRHNRLDETRIAPLAWINLRSLESIDLSHNDIYLVPSYLPRSLLHLVLVGNHIQRIPGYVFAHMEPGLEYLYLSYNKLDGEGTEPESFFGVYHSMVELCLDHNQLVSVPSGINQMNTLHFLRLNDNNIRWGAADSTLVAVRLENNQLDPDNTSPSSFSCVRSASSVANYPIHQQTNYPVHQQANYPVHQQTNYPVHQQANYPIHQQTNYPANYPVHQQANYPVHQQANYPVHQQANYPVHQQTNYPVHQQANYPVHHQANYPVHHQANYPVHHQANYPVHHQANYPVHHQANY
ncbi:hypothetical protein CRUP_012734, partial [Coryphaenoides rupestris]